jgi:hypothetical protein
MRTWRCRAAGILRRDIWLGALIERARCNIQSAGVFGGGAETVLPDVGTLYRNGLGGKELRTRLAAGWKRFFPG